MPDFDFASSLSYELHVNGASNAFMREIGCKCHVCLGNERCGNTSVSFIIRQNDVILYHILVDCGPTVVDAIIDASFPPPDVVFLTHEHIDHVGGLDRLVLCQKRNVGFTPLIYGSKGTLENGPKRFFPKLPVTYEVLSPYKKVYMRKGGRVVASLTAVPVYHGPSSVEPTIFVLEFGENPRRKIVFAWDFLHLIPRYPLEDSDENYKGLSALQESFVDEHKSLFSNVDFLFLDANTCNSHPETGHNSIDASFKFIILEMAPKRTYFIHYSGHEDKSGPMSRKELQEWIKRYKMHHIKKDFQVNIAAMGDRFYVV